MRTTVNLDDDVAAAVDSLRRERGTGLSEAVNELVRAALARAPAPASYRHRSAALGLRLDVRDVGEALEVLDRADAD